MTKKHKESFSNLLFVVILRMLYWVDKNLLWIQLMIEKMKGEISKPIGCYIEELVCNRGWGCSGGVISTDTDPDLPD